MDWLAIPSSSTLGVKMTILHQKVDFTSSIELEGIALRSLKTSCLGSCAIRRIGQFAQLSLIGN